MTKSNYRIDKAVEEVEPLLAIVRAADASLLSLFPRPIEEILPIAGGQVNVFDRPQASLSNRLVAQVLRDEFRVPEEHLPEPSDQDLLGFIFCRGNDAVIFYSRAHGNEAARFTMAHELGHLHLDYMPELAASKQVSLFGQAQRHSSFSRRDTFDEIDAGFGDLPEGPNAASKAPRRSATIEKREMRANAFAAELLAPRDEVRRCLSGVENRDEHVELVRERFGLSKQAARFRVDDVLGPSTGQTRFEPP